MIIGLGPKKGIIIIKMFNIGIVFKVQSLQSINIKVLIKNMKLLLYIILLNDNSHNMFIFYLIWIYTSLILINNNHRL